ncbi:MAG: endonuclease domain-containing protein [Novosphingobium sp.]|nr:endonuclease domain-containing protein [Novosphingobium sp.]
MRDRSRSLRSNSTDAERKLWQQLRNRNFAGAKFRRQVQIGSYIVDFLCPAARIVVEVDGGQHSREADAARTSFLEEQGFCVIRFWNNDVLQNLEGVLKLIEEALPTPPHPAQSDD